jgi:hypothetical protein
MEDFEKAADCGECYRNIKVLAMEIQNLANIYTIEITGVGLFFGGVGANKKGTRKWRYIL